MVERKGYDWPENFSIAVWTGLGIVDIAKKWTSVLAEEPMWLPLIS